MKRIILMNILAAVFCVTAAAQQAMPSLLLSDDPVALAHAGSSVALKADAFSVGNNTAAMSFYEGTLDAAFSYGVWQPSAQKNGIIGIGAIGKIGKKLALGLDLKFVNQPSVEIYDLNAQTPQLNGTYKPGENNFTLGASYKITEWMSAGANVKLATSKLSPEAKATCFAADIYAAFKSSFGLTGGVGICNLGSKANYGGETSYAIPSYLRAGAAYSIAGVSADLELDYMFSGAVMAGVSAGYWFKEYAGINIGYHYGTDKANNGTEAAVNPLCIPSYLSIGFGGQIKGIHLDFAYLLGSNALKNSLSFSVGYRF